MSQQDYVREKLLNALSVLAGAGDFRQRLHDAWLACHTLKADDFADPAQGQKFVEWEDLLGIGSANTAPVAARLRAMSDDQLVLVGEGLRDLAMHIAWEGGR